MIGSTITENAAFMHEVLGVRPVRFQPSIPHLVYQYDFYTGACAAQRSVRARATARHCPRCRLSTQCAERAKPGDSRVVVARNDERKVWFPQSTRRWRARARPPAPPARLGRATCPSSCTASARRRPSGASPYSSCSRRTRRRASRSPPRARIRPAQASRPSSSAPATPHTSTRAPTHTDSHARASVKTLTPARAVPPPYAPCAPRLRSASQLCPRTRCGTSPCIAVQRTHQGTDDHTCCS